MTPSIARRVAGNGALVLVAALVLVGIGTGAALHVQRTRALDKALLAAVHGRAHPEVAAEIEVEHSHPPVDAWGWRKKKIARVAAAAQLPEEGSKDEDVTWHLSAEGVCDGIAALKRQGVASHVHESSRICYKWSGGEWYMATVQKSCSCVCSCLFVHAVAIFGCVEAFPDSFCLWA